VLEEGIIGVRFPVGAFIYFFSTGKTSFVKHTGVSLPGVKRPGR